MPPKLTRSPVALDEADSASNQLDLDKMISLIVSVFPFDQSTSRSLVGLKNHRAYIERFFSGKCGRLVFYSPREDLVYLREPLQANKVVAEPLPAKTERKLSAITTGKSFMDGSQISIRSFELGRLDYSSPFLDVDGDRFENLFGNNARFELDKSSLKQMRVSHCYPNEKCDLIVHLENTEPKIIRSDTEFYAQVFSQFALFNFEKFEVPMELLSLAFSTTNFGTHLSYHHPKLLNCPAHAQRMILKSSGCKSMDFFTRKPVKFGRDKAFSGQLRAVLECVYNSANKLRFVPQNAPPTTVNFVDQLSIAAEFSRLKSELRMDEQILKQAFTQSRGEAFVFVHGINGFQTRKLFETLKTNTQLEMVEISTKFRIFRRISQALSYCSAQNKMITFDALIGTLVSSKIFFDDYNQQKTWTEFVRIISADLMKIVLWSVNLDLIVNQNCQKEMFRLMAGVEYYNRYHSVLRLVLQSIMSSDEVSELFVDINDIVQLPNKRMAQIIYILKSKQLYKSIGGQVKSPENWLQSLLTQHLPDFICAFQLLNDLPPFRHSLNQIYSRKFDNVFQNFNFQLNRIYDGIAESIRDLKLKAVPLDDLIQLNSLIIKVLPRKTNSNVYSSDCDCLSKSLNPIIDSLKQSLVDEKESQSLRRRILLVEKIKSCQNVVQKFLDGCISLTSGDLSVLEKVSNDLKLIDHKLHKILPDAKHLSISKDISTAFEQLSLANVFKLDQSRVIPKLILQIPNDNCLTLRRPPPSLLSNKKADEAIRDELKSYILEFNRNLGCFKYFSKRLNRNELCDRSNILSPILRKILNSQKQTLANDSAIKWMAKPEQLKSVLKSILKTEELINRLKWINETIVKAISFLAKLEFVFIKPKMDQRLDEAFLEQNMVMQNKNISQVFMIYSQVCKLLKHMGNLLKSECQQEQFDAEMIDYLLYLDRLFYESVNISMRNSLISVYRLFDCDSTRSKPILFHVSTRLTGIRHLKVSFDPPIDVMLKTVHCLCTTSLVDNFHGFRSLLGIFFEGEAPMDLLETCVLSLEVKSLQSQIDGLCEGFARQAVIAFESLIGQDYDILLEGNELENFSDSELNSETMRDIDESLSSYGKILVKIARIPDHVKLGCVLFDCRNLKTSLSDLCNSCTLVYTENAAKLVNLVADKVGKFIKESNDRMNRCPSKYKHVKIYDRVVNSIGSHNNRITNILTGIQNFIGLLDKHNRKISRNTLNKFQRTNLDWSDHEKRLERAYEQCALMKTKFRYQLEFEIDCWQDTVEIYSSGFSQDCPSDPSLDMGRVKRELNDWKELADDLSNFKPFLVEALDDLSLKRPIPSPDSDFIENVAKMIEIWTKKEEYDNMRKEWDGVRFADLSMNDFEDYVIYNHKQMMKFSGDEDRLAIFEFMKNEFSKLKNLTPILLALHNPFMQERHWAVVKTMTNSLITQKVVDLPFSEVIELSLDKFGNVLIETSDGANREYEIEKSLSTITQQWQSASFEVVKSGKQTMKIKTLDIVLDLAISTQIQISAIQGSKFASFFADRIKYWENIAKEAIDFCEVLADVQRRYLYMEGLFRSPDVKKQIPTETEQFQTADNIWILLLRVINKQKHVPKLLETSELTHEFSKLQKHLESIQNRLEIYLETKRVKFPRFYFISNDTLVRILSLSSRPQEVFVYLKMLFDNIASVRVENNYANAMVSSESELVPLSRSVDLRGNVEDWLKNLELSMSATVRSTISATISSLNKNEARFGWIKTWPGQCLVTCGEIVWTANVAAAFTKTDGLSKVEIAQTKLLREYSAILRNEDLSDLHRQKLIALITKEVHGRDVIRRLISAGVAEPGAFEWIMQLRQYWEQFEQSGDHCVIRQLHAVFRHCYEYIGCCSRLVMTPLTDRCYMTLTAALNLCRGGSPKGPAGTGKTETVKDLGKTLGTFVLVTNCSEGLNYKQIGKTLSGIAQSGSWGCFDEFNRINIEVLSVVAQQIQSILDAMKSCKKSFVFENRTIRLVQSAGIFVTMNPGYAGRTELPDNLKSLFRPIAMIVPDYIYIAEISLFSEGFDDTEVLASKICTAFQLADQQLSKQPHYDFGLRSMTSLLRYAGMKRRQLRKQTDLQILELSIREVNLPRLTRDDLRLFQAICQDIFPEIQRHLVSDSTLLSSLGKAAIELNLELSESLARKAVQLADTKSTRHAVMLVGDSMTGKTSCWRILQNAFNLIAGRFNIDVERINSKAIDEVEMFGSLNLSTGEWTDGIVSSIIRNACQIRNSQKWILFDGPVDADWIENMNSLMDDNKLLTLANGERILMPSERVFLLFETEDLKVASPATVSRCGIIYFDSNDLTWKSLVGKWLRKHSEKVQPILKQLLDTMFDRLLSYKSNQNFELITLSPISAFLRFTYLFDELIGRIDFPQIHFADSVKRLVVYCSIWSVCANMNISGRRSIDMIVREFDRSIPNRDLVYEYFVDCETANWRHWDEAVVDRVFEPKQGLPFFHNIVPTLDTVRSESVLNTFLDAGKPVMVVGLVGTGKSSICRSMINASTPKTNSLTIYFSAQTSSKYVQNTIEAAMEKFGKNSLKPKDGKKLIVFLDDIHMPRTDSYGSQPPLEIVRQLLNEKGWYNRSTQQFTRINDISIVTSMGVSEDVSQTKPIPNRLKSILCSIALNTPSDKELHRIYDTLLGPQTKSAPDDLKRLFSKLIDATIELFKKFGKTFMPIPSKLHYTTNLRDVGKVCEGLTRFNVATHLSDQTCLKLWTFECYRVFNDRLITEDDQHAFSAIMAEILSEFFGLPLNQLCSQGKPPIFADVLNSKNVYELIDNEIELKTKIERCLDDYNRAAPLAKLDITLFSDAIDHVMRIVRVLQRPRGNLLLLGIGGSGRKSLSKLAAHICGFQTVQLTITKTYGLSDFREDIKKMYKIAGINNRELVFIFNDNQILQSEFFEDIGNVLNGGVVPNLFSIEDFEEIRNGLERAAQRENLSTNFSSLLDFMYSRVRANLHVVLCMNPFVDDFRNNVRMFPSVVNCTTIDYFGPWPKDALVEVAVQNFSNSDLSPHNDRIKVVAEVVASFHMKVSEYCEKMSSSIRRTAHATPSNYLQFIRSTKTTLVSRRKDTRVQMVKLEKALKKVADTKRVLTEAALNLDEKRKVVATYQESCEQFLVLLEEQKQEAAVRQKNVTVQSAKLQEEEVSCKQIAGVAEAELNEAMPMLDAAIRALNTLSSKDIDEIASYNNPPKAIEEVMAAVMILKRKSPEWSEARRDLADTNFVNSLISFDKDHIPEKVLKKISAIVRDANFNPTAVGKISSAAKSVCSWVIAIEAYAKVFKIVKPKIDRYDKAKKMLESKQADFTMAISNLNEVQAQIKQLEIDYVKKLDERNALQKSAEETAMFLERAAKMLEGTADKTVQWENSLELFNSQMDYLAVESMLDSASLNYLGAFTPNFREKIYEDFNFLLKRRQLQTRKYHDWLASVTSEVEMVNWSICGLPRDVFSAQNATIALKTKRVFVYLIDPQSQAVKWLKTLYRKKEIVVIDVREADLVSRVEKSIENGKVCLVQNVGNDIPSSLDSIISNDVNYDDDGSRYLKLGDDDKKIVVDAEFKLFLATKISNPRLSSDVFSKVTVVNFAVKEDGLKEQLLEVLVKAERPDLAKEKVELTRTVAEKKIEKQRLEDEFLRLIEETEGSLLENVEVLNSLNESNRAAQDISNVLKRSQEAESEIDEARSVYLSLARKAADLFFVLEDIGLVHGMYRFSLDAYGQLIEQSISDSRPSNNAIERIGLISDTLLQNFSRFANNCLFQEHRLLFTFQMCIKLLQSQDLIDLDEYNFFIRGSIQNQKTKSQQVSNNLFKSWLPDEQWISLSLLSRLRRYRTLPSTFIPFAEFWRKWYFDLQPEKNPLPGGIEAIAGNLCRLQIVKILRIDRLTNALKHFIETSIGGQFIDPPAPTKEMIYRQSSPYSPVLFILSPGTDPLNFLRNLAEEMGMDNQFYSVSLGQGQSDKAMNLLENATANGDWVYLANCHLSESWLPKLDKFIDDLQVSRNCHPKFRIWLSCSPIENFPINTLQLSIKITTEPPAGIKQNMTRIMRTLSPAEQKYIDQNFDLRRLIYPLSLFHSIILERQKFGKIGWTNVYHFNDSDYSVSVRLSAELIRIYSDRFPWSALRFMIASVMYGGHVTDRFDLRLLETYIGDLFNESTKNQQDNPYRQPKDGPLSHYLEQCGRLPSSDAPSAFGLHSNSETASRVAESKTILSQLLKLLPPDIAFKAETSTEQARNDKVFESSAEIIRSLPQQIPRPSRGLANGQQRQIDPYVVCLYHEIDRYNSLLSLISSTLLNLQNAIRGRILMSFELEQVFGCVLDSRVPQLWHKYYESNKSLGAWIQDLARRVKQISDWAKNGKIPQPLWISGLSLPAGLLTAVKQKHSRQFRVPVDVLSWRFEFVAVDGETSPNVRAKTKSAEGIVLSGFYLDGASWDKKSKTIVDPSPKNLFGQMPAIRFIPSVDENRRVSLERTYNCPCYYTSARSTDNFLIAVDVPFGDGFSSDHFVKRGTALILNLDE